MKLPTRIWLVACNDTLVGWAKTRRAARETAALRESLPNVSCDVLGPYVLLRSSR